MDHLVDLARRFGEETNRVFANAPTRRSAMIALRRACYTLSETVSDPMVRGLLGFYIACFTNRSRFETFERYLESLYLSRDYEFFRNLKPVEAARYARLYLSRKGTRINLKYFPMLIRIARRVKKRILDRMGYRMRRNPLLPPESAFEEVQADYRRKTRPKSPRRRKSS